MPRERLDEIASVTDRLTKRLSRRLRNQVIHQAEALPLRLDMATLLDYVRDNRVIGTQNTGNLPFAAVREVTARFVDPPPLESRIGDYIYRVRSAIDIWPLYLLHILVDAGRLVSRGRVRRWRLTRRGAKFLNTDPLTQVLFLLDTWWHRVDWLVAYPFEGMGRGLPPDFTRIALVHLRALPVGKRTRFEPFADRLIGAGALTWTAQDASFAREALHGAVERMVLSILEDFGAARLEDRRRRLGRGTISELAAFRITPFGRWLLDAIAT